MLPNLGIILQISDPVVIKGLLTNGFADLFGNRPFESMSDQKIFSQPAVQTVMRLMRKRICKAEGDNP